MGLRPASIDIEVVKHRIVQARRAGRGGQILREAEPLRNPCHRARVVARVPVPAGIILARQVHQDGLRIAQHEAVVVDYRQLTQRIDREKRGILVLPARIKNRAEVKAQQGH